MYDELFTITDIWLQRMRAADPPSFDEVLLEYRRAVTHAANGRASVLYDSNEVTGALSRGDLSYTALGRGGRLKSCLVIGANQFTYGSSEDQIHWFERDQRPPAGLILPSEFLYPLVPESETIDWLLTRAEWSPISGIASGSTTYSAPFSTEPDGYKLLLNFTPRGVYPAAVAVERPMRRTRTGESEEHPPSQVASLTFYRGPTAGDANPSCWPFYEALRFDATGAPREVVLRYYNIHYARQMSEQDSALRLTLPVRLRSTTKLFDRRSDGGPAFMGSDSSSWPDEVLTALRPL